MNLVQYLWQRACPANGGRRPPGNLPGYQCAQGRIGIAVTAFCGLPSITYEADWKFISRLDEVKAVVREDQAEELA
ncbi:hypothetical protein [Pseudomonas putida]|uniref:Uncharacterized protein n=1 Tax=Pseudomonas putida TaxID=303 RepID=A0ABD7BED3_PSEPU|nr:hypothetical protein [Pseudomonas putida]QOC98847.1 hypothetical protein ID616_03840 [Pseudomonas putida]